MIDIGSELSRDFHGWGTVHGVDGFLETTIETLSGRGFKPDNSHLIYSVCPDEINRLHCRRTIELALQDVFDGEFHLGNLAAYPIGGITGISAASHHVPDRMEGGRIVEEGNLIFFVSPHVGVTIGQVQVEGELLTASVDGGIEYGKVRRPGQEHDTSCCGAMMALMEHAPELLDETRVAGLTGNRLDIAKGILFTELVENHRQDVAELLELPGVNERVIALAKINYELVAGVIKDEISRFIDSDPFHGHIAMIGGITVNAGDKDYFVSREIEFIH